MNKTFYSQKIIFTYSDIDANDNVFPSSILLAFQNIAGIHANLLNTGYQPFIERDLIWVVDKIHFKIYKKIPYLEELTLETWPLKPSSLAVTREAIIKNAKGDILLKLSSYWCILNVKTRRLVRTKEVKELNRDDYLDKTNFETEFFNLPAFDYTNLKETLNYQVLFTDLDHNKHMNNTNYARLIVSSIPNIENSEVSEMQINFSKENYKNDLLRTYVKENSEKEYQIIGVKNNSEVSFNSYVKIK